MTFNPDEPRDAHGEWTAGGAYDKLTVNSILNDPTTAKPGSRSNPDIAKELNARGQAALKALGIPGGVIEEPRGKEGKRDRTRRRITSFLVPSLQRSRTS